MTCLPGGHSGTTGTFICFIDMKSLLQLLPNYSCVSLLLWNSNTLFSDEASMSSQCVFLAQTPQEVRADKRGVRLWLRGVGWFFTSLVPSLRVCPAFPLGHLSAPCCQAHACALPYPVAPLPREGGSLHRLDPVPVQPQLSRPSS